MAHLDELVPALDIWLIDCKGNAVCWCESSHSAVLVNKPLERAITVNYHCLRSSLIVTQRNVVFVLDDDPDMLRALGRLLKVHGLYPKLCASPETFFATSDNDEAICLLLDVHLDAVSGIDVKRSMLRSGVRLPVIFITGKDSEATRRLVEEVGCVAYLPKPFSAKSLMEAIQLADGNNLNSPDFSHEQNQTQGRNVSVQRSASKRVQKHSMDLPSPSY